jgi:hypothetical protein
MNSGTRTVLVAALVAPMLGLAASGADRETGRTNLGTQKRYASPKAVFDAYREAREKHDKRKLFSLLTPNAQNYAVFESFFACTEQGSKEMGSIVPTYVDLPATVDDYEKRYKKKHGIDPAKPLPPDAHDGELWCDAIVSHVKDKAGFYEAVSNHFDERAAKRHEKRPVPPLGELQHLDVHGEWASGTAKLTIIPGPGESPPRVNPIDKSFRFRKVNGGWLIDSL